MWISKTKISSAAVAVAVLASCSSPGRTPKAADPDRPTLRVMTYNVNYGLAGDDGIIGVIRDLDSDVVFLRYRLEQIRRFYGVLEGDMPTLIVGDFNEGSDEKAMKFLASRGLSNAKHAFEPGKPTWRWKTSIGSISSEFDHIVHDERLEPLDAWVVERGRSDHFPVVAVFQLGSQR